VNAEDKELFKLLHILELSVKISPTSFTNGPTMSLIFDLLLA